VHWSNLERETMADQRWWSPADLGSTDEEFYPENIVEILDLAGTW
jgi:hypothetical protein